MLALLDNHSDSLSFFFTKIPDYKPISEIGYRDIPLFQNDESELGRQRNLLLPQSILINSWFMHMRNEDNAIREKAALFWHHHIPSTMRDVLSGSALLEIYRKNALGKLRDLLKEIIVNKSILYFLTGRNSDKRNPNENFARELLELHTLGEGNYTQSDIIQVAKAFTGIHPDEKSNSYTVRPQLYDDSIKTIFGKKGKFDRFDVIDLILEQEQTAKHICKEVLTFYGNLNPSQSHVELCADIYRKSDYSFLHLLHYIFSSDWFYRDLSYRNKVKTPVELFIGFQRQTGYKLIGPKAHQIIMRSLGQSIFYPHNVAGWQEGPRWLQGKNILNRKFLLLALLDTANRPFERSSLQYKIYSRVVNPQLRQFRYTMDGTFDEKALKHLLRKQGISLQNWMLHTVDGNSNKLESMKEILLSNDYQYI